MNKMRELTRWKQRLKDRERIVKRVFETAEGQQLLALLNDTFTHGDLIGKDTHDTYYRLGQRDVVEFLNHLNSMETE